MKTSLAGLVRTRAPWEDLFAADPFHPGWEEVLYEPQVLAGFYDPAEDERAASIHGRRWEGYDDWIRQRRLRAEGRLWLVSGEPLSSESRRAFDLDGARYASVRAFYDSLKVGDEISRAAVAACVYDGPRGRILRPKAMSFRYGGRDIDVGSVEHCALVARATEAKVLAHEDVRAALFSTRRSRLDMGAIATLGRSMPFALMVMRERLR